MTKNELESTLKEIKYLFLVYRNGIVADSLKSATYPYQLIYGLQLPEITQISKKFQKDLTLADELWSQSHIRESRLLACHLFPFDIEMEKAENLIADLKTFEEAEILNFRLLRNLPYFIELIEKLKNSGSENENNQYCLRMMEKVKELSGL